VPTISRFFGITIAMYFDDHGHPHFPARRAGPEAKIRIDHVEVIESALPVRDRRHRLRRALQDAGLRVSERSAARAPAP
jgi:hypothetical protein